MILGPNDLLKLRDELFARPPDRDLYLHLGFFQCWFSAVELRITFLLAMALNYRQLDEFELLVKGMDARVKIERLRKALKKRHTLGPTFKTRLQHFEDKIIPLRNKVAHSWVTLPEPTTFHFVTLARMPTTVPASKLLPEPSETMAELDLFAHGLWLAYYSEDLGQLVRGQVPPGIVEITHPRSPAPKAPPDSRPPQAPRAKRHKKPKNNPSGC